MRFGKHGVVTPTEAVDGRRYETQHHKMGLGQFDPKFSGYYVAVPHKLREDVSVFIPTILSDIEVWELEQEKLALQVQVANANQEPDKEAEAEAKAKLAKQKALRDEIKALQTELATSEGSTNKTKTVKVSVPKTEDKDSSG